MPMSPQEDAEGPVRVVVTHDGVPLADSAALISVTVRRALNKVPAATLVFSDGDMPQSKFPLSDSAALQPGAEVVINAGYGDDEARVFAGIVVKHGLTISSTNDARLVIECRDKAIKMTVGRRSARYEDQTDGAILSRLVSSHGLGADISGATLTHAQRQRRRQGGRPECRL